MTVQDHARRSWASWSAGPGAPLRHADDVRERREAEAFDALHVVVDPELDEPVTDLGFVRSLEVGPVRDSAGADAGAGLRVEAHLRLPTSFCSPNFAYLMASDAKDALTALPWAAEVVVELDDHHDSELINVGLATDAGYRGTFAHEAEKDLDELRATFKRKAHTAAVERSLTALLRAGREVEDLVDVRLGDLPDDDTTAALHRRRSALGLPADDDAPVFVDHLGRPVERERADAVLRRARSTRISIEGNAHFCRGLLGTRYPDEPGFVPLSSITVKEHSA